MAETILVQTGGRITLTITLTASDFGSLVGTNVKITEVNSGLPITSFSYDGQPENVKIPAGVAYRVQPGDAIGYLAPEGVEGVATENRSISFVYQKCNRMGFKRKKAESDPEARIEYIFDAVNKTPMKVNLVDGTPNYGDWEDFINEVATPVMLKTDGTEAYELNRNDQTKKAAGGNSDISNTSYDGNAMVRFGGKWKWVKRYEDETYEYVIFADRQYDDDYHAYAHTDENGVVQDKFYLGMYMGSYSNNKLRSIADASIMNYTTRNTEVSRAQANGSGYGTTYKSAWDYVCDLLTLVSKTDNAQAAFGNGVGISTASGSEYIKTGTTKAYGGFWGSNVETKDVKVFWIECFWGNYWEAMQGFFCNALALKTKMTPPYNFNGSGYFDTGKSLPDILDSSFITKASVTDGAGFIPVEASGGTSTTYYCDPIYTGYQYANSSKTGYVIFGGNVGSANGVAGPRTLSCGVGADWNRIDISTRLSYIPKTVKG